MVRAAGGRTGGSQWGANLTEHRGGHVTETESKSSSRHELCPFLFVRARYRTHRGNARPATRLVPPTCEYPERGPAISSSGAVPDVI